VRSGRACRRRHGQTHAETAPAGVTGTRDRGHDVVPLVRIGTFDWRISEKDEATLGLAAATP
jgi:hypothetical protein